MSAASNDNTFVDPHDKFWSMYISSAEKLDKTRTERWKGDAEGILIFTGLFAATVAQFLSSALANLSPNAGDQTVALLSQILVSLSNETDRSQAAASAMVLPSPTFEPANSALWINSLWLISLFLALFSALGATLVQQWSRNYAHDAQRRGKPGLRGPVYAILAMGVNRFKMEHSVATILTLLHLSVLFFCSGLLINIFSVNMAVAKALAACMAAGGLLYIVLSVLPVVSPDTPYHTPLTSVLRIGVRGVLLFTTNTVALAYAVLHLLHFVSQKRFHEVLDLISKFSKTTLKARDRLVESDPSTWEEEDSVSRHLYAFKQVHSTADELHEIEFFWDSVSIFVTSSSTSNWHATALACSIIQDMNVFRDVSKLLDSCFSDAGSRSSFQLPIDKASSQRAAVAFSLVRSFTNFRSGADGNGQHNAGTSGSTYALLVLRSLMESRVLAYFTDNLVPSGRRCTKLIFGCFLAAIRTDVLLLGLDRYSFLVLEPQGSQIYSRVLALVSLWRVQSDFSLTAISLRHQFLANFVWLVEFLAEFSSGESGTEPALEELYDLWTLLVAHVYAKAYRYVRLGGNRKLHRDLLLEFLTKIHVRDSLLHDLAASPHIINYEQLVADVEYVRLFDKYPELRFMFGEICREVFRIPESPLPLLDRLPPSRSLDSPEQIMLSEV